jgi:serine/threonine protein kinase
VQAPAPGENAAGPLRATLNGSPLSTNRAQGGTGNTGSGGSIARNLGAGGAIFNSLGSFQIDTGEFLAPSIVNRRVHAALSEHLAADPRQPAVVGSHEDRPTVVLPETQSVLDGDSSSNWPRIYLPTEYARARQNSLGRLVALKFLPSDCAYDDVWLARFRLEARTASALNHPNICTVYDTGDSAGRPYLSMELVEGRTLEAPVTPPF